MNETIDYKKQYDEAIEKYSYVSDGTTQLAIMQEPYLCQDEYGKAIYGASGMARDGTEYNIRWYCVPGYEIFEESSDHCDWEDFYTRKL